jgi:ketosteroid isomerase-like protein
VGLRNGKGNIFNTEGREDTGEALGSRFFKGLIWIALLCPLAYGAGCPQGQMKEPTALEQAEQTWAQALEQRDAATLGCLLADEFEDADPSGKLTDRAATLAGVATRRAGHNELSELKAHVHGDVGYIRGKATAIDGQGKVVARVRFTDIYVYREGRWQCVAAHESLMAEAGH